MMLVFTLDYVYPRMRDIYVDTIKTGLGGYHGNKGSVSIRFLLDDSSICFCNVHLAAHQNELISRNNDAATIIKDTRFKALLQNYTVDGGDGTMILDHESVVLAGDLNYRLESLGRLDVLRMVEERNWTSLVEHDQLTEQLLSNPYFALADFSEGQITFCSNF